jgi:hypothetical protein
MKAVPANERYLLVISMLKTGAKLPLGSFHQPEPAKIP